MVERPIKKSERQAMMQAAETAGETAAIEIDSSENGSSTGTEALPKRETPRPVRVNKDSEKRISKEARDGSSRGKGKGKSRDVEPAKPASMALMRGPRPVKAKDPETAEESLEAPTIDELTTGVEEESASSGETEQVTES